MRKSHVTHFTPCTVITISLPDHFQVITMKSEFIGQKQEHGPQNIYTD
jgi:hypothetical protein